MCRYIKYNRSNFNFYNLLGMHNGEQVNCCDLNTPSHVKYNTYFKVYRICEITGVVPYKRLYPVGNKKTDKALMLMHGKAEKLFKMDLVSNHRFDEVINL